ncbi:hypothetical protein N9996_00915 [Synechococcus sp. AH-603-M21]|nr:hypothetical protein [Synechococcus sp. AH-603-M21]
MSGMGGSETIDGLLCEPSRVCWYIAHVQPYPELSILVSTFAAVVMTDSEVAADAP